MPEHKYYPTGWVGLWYTNDVDKPTDNRWRFVRADTKQFVGPIYRSKADLLAAARPYAITNGFRVKEVVDVNAEAKPLPPSPLVPITAIKVGATADSFFRRYWGACAPPGSPPPHCDDPFRVAIRNAFLMGFAAMNDVTRRVGEPDVSADDGVTWLEALRLECCRELGINPNA